MQFIRGCILISYCICLISCARSNLAPELGQTTTPPALYRGGAQATAGAMVAPITHLY